MKLEKLINKISSIAAVLVIYIVALSFYLGAKGFYIDSNHNIVLKAPEAIAAESPKTIPLNANLPWGHSIGSSSAPITIYEYSSFGCSHCADFHKDTLPQLMKNEINTGKVRLVFTPYPLDKASLKAAVLAECVSKTRYFDFINTLFEKQFSWGMSLNTEKSLAKLAEPFGISASRAEACMKALDEAQEILTDRQEATSVIGIEGTPTFVIATKKSREVVFGFMNYNELKSKIENLLGR